MLRLHPKSDPRDFEIYHSEIAAISEGGDALEAVWASDIVLGLPTMLMVESLLMGRPALGVLPTPRELSYLAAFQWGLVPAVWTRHDLHVKLATFATWKIDKIALDTYCPPFAISRIADALVDLDCVNTSVQDAWTV